MFIGVKPKAYAFFRGQIFTISYYLCQMHFQILLAVLELNQIVHSQKLIHANISLGPGLRN